MRKKIVAGNWKMNFGAAKAAEFAGDLAKSIKTDKSDVVFCVPFVSLPAAIEAVKGTGIGVGAQNMHFEDAGAYTGEVSASMLVELGVKYVIIGHSERREYFGETDETVRKKLAKALSSGLIPIVCVGEKKEQYEQGVTLELIRSQLKIALGGLSAEQVKGIIIAYEPVWAIGTGLSATAEQANTVCSAIRALIAELYGAGCAEAVRIQYGGSVSAKNAAELFACPDIDGALVGGASLKPEFAELV